MIDKYLLFHSQESLQIHLGVCGSIAAYRAIDLVRFWKDVGLSISVTLTPAACNFLTPLAFSAVGASSVYTTMFGDGSCSYYPYTHLEPGKTSQAFIIAPASAATISRLSHGQADELLACQVLAFPGQPIIAPAMNPYMWNHPSTQQNIKILQERGCIIIEPDQGHVACGDEGQGRLADLREIYLIGLKSITPQDFAGLRILITLGPTREPWDGLRFWSNPATGIMGSSLAIAAWMRGAEVHAICGPGSPWLPSGIHYYPVTTALQMFEAAEGIWSSADIGIFVAAVSDFAPEKGPEGKFKKNEVVDGFTLRFVRNTDILEKLSCNRKRNQKIVGFALESEHLEQAVQNKLYTKKADMIIGNYIKDGLACLSSTVFVLDRNGREARWETMTKTDIAWRILSWLKSL